METHMLSLEDIIKITNGHCINNVLPTSTKINNINIYVDKIQKGDVFVALNSQKYSNTDGCLGFTGNEDSVFGFAGEKNGYDDINEAINKGAIAIIVDNIKVVSSNYNCNFIYVDDSLDALCSLSSEILKKSKVKTIAISGSVGKTTTASYLNNILATKYKVLKSDYIRSTVLGLAIEIIEKIDNTIDFYIVELQSDGVGQIQKMCKSIVIDYAIITEITDSHLSKFQSINNIIFEKTTTYRYLNRNGFILINNDNEHLKKWYLENSHDKRIITVGTNNNSVYFVDNHFNFNVASIEKKQNDSSVLGKLCVNNSIDIHAVLLCISFFELINNNCISIKEINSILNTIKPTYLRYNKFLGKNNCIVIIDSYNASYLSMKTGIAKACADNSKKVILVLGSMLELAGNTEILHKEIGKQILQYKNITNIFLLGENMLYTYFTLKKFSNNKHVVHSFSYEKIINELLKVELNENTLVYIKGSGAMRMELIAPYVLSSMEALQ